MSSSRPRAVVIGSGHNGLIAARELKERGFDVTVLEAREKIGGLTETKELCGAKVGRTSYVLGLMPLDLVKKYGIPVIRIDPFQVFYVDGKVVPFFVNSEYRRRKLEELKLPELAEVDRKIVEAREVFYSKYLFVDKPVSIKEFREGLAKKGLEEFADLTAKEFLEKYVPEEFRGFYVYRGLEGSPAFIVAYYYSPQWSLVKGGNGTIAEVLAQGLKVETRAEVVELVEKGGKVIRAVTRDGRAFEGDLFIFAGSPVNFWRILGKRVPKLGTPAWRKYNAVLEERPDLGPIKQFTQSIIDTEFGEIMFPSEADSSRGGITMEMMGDFEEAVKEFKLKVKCYEEVTAKEAEEEYFLPYGQVNHLPMTREYLFENRPGYETEFENVFLASAGTYPGGQILGVQGVNAVRVSMKKLHFQT